MSNEQEYDYQHRPNVAANVNRDPAIHRYGRSHGGKAGSVSRSYTVTDKGNAALAWDERSIALADGPASPAAMAYYKKQIARLDGQIATASALVVLLQNERAEFVREMQASQNARGE